jgi:hypothetical protein
VCESFGIGGWLSKAIYRCATCNFFARKTQDKREVIAAGAKKAKKAQKAQTIRWNTNLLCQPRSHFEIRELPGCYSTEEFDFSVQFKLRCYLTVVTASFGDCQQKVSLTIPVTALLMMSILKTFDTG